MFKQTALAALITIALCIPAEAKILIGDVVGVTDGDTVTVRVDGEDISIRIRGIDAPELEQEYGEEAKAALTGFLLKRQAIISGEEKDAAGRLLASLAVNGNDAGLYMLENGGAWFRLDYESQLAADWRTAYRTAQSEAKSKGVGLWIAVRPVPPWSWRKQQREAAQLEEEIRGESLEGVTKELKSNFDILEDNWRYVKKRLFGEGSDLDEEDFESTQPPKERPSFWELAAKIGEGCSRWLKAFFSSLF